MTARPDVLDNRRTPCAVGLIQIAQRMHELPPGNKLEVWSRDIFAPMEISLWAARDGHLVESHTMAGMWPRRFHVFVIVR
jgi:TusA-related sulfurtransferase